MCGVILLALLVVGCAAVPARPAPLAAADSEDYSTEIAVCAQVTNQYRASIGKPPLTRSSALEEYATTAARIDGTAKIAHHHARTTRLGNGLSRAENAILWWSLRYYGTVESVVRRGLDDMWKEGDGGSHYRNLVGNYTETGCGIFVNGDEVTVVQAFR